MAPLVAGLLSWLSLLLLARHALSLYAAPHNFVYFTTCDYQGEKYPPGFFSPDPCVNCNCSASTGEVHCAFKDCPPVGNCVELAHTPGECCPRCLQRGCWHRGQAYPAGAKITGDNCQRCYCPWEGGEPESGAAVCVDISCQPVRCVDAAVPRAKCCPVCPNGPNCWLDERIIPEGKRIYIDKCQFCYCSNMEYIYNATRRHATCVRSFFCI